MTSSPLSVAHPDPRARFRRAIPRVLTAAFVVFVLDGLYVIVELCLIRQKATVEQMFQGIASSVLGEAARSGGWQTAGIGVFLHFCVSLSWSAVWMIAYESSAPLRRAVASTPRALLIGAAYGVFVWFMMRQVILPFTFAKPGSVMTLGALLVFIAHIFVVGPPIILIERNPSA